MARTTKKQDKWDRKAQRIVLCWAPNTVRANIPDGWWHDLYTDLAATLRGVDKAKDKAIAAAYRRGMLDQKFYDHGSPRP